jgi:hypothetical protein
MARGGAAAFLATAVLLATAPSHAAAKDIVVGGAIGWGLGAAALALRMRDSRYYDTGTRERHR